MKNVVQTFNLENLAVMANAISDIAEGTIQAQFALPTPKTAEDAKTWILQYYTQTAGVLESIFCMANFMADLLADHELTETAANPVDDLEEHGS